MNVEPITTLTDKAPQPYLDRELSWIDFNTRVLEEGMNSDSPLMERLKFLGIVSSNFDEFFMVRMASLDRNTSFYKEAYLKAFEVMKRQSEYWNQILLPELHASGFIRISMDQLKASDRQHINSLFDKELLPLLTPIALRSGESKAPLVNLTNYLVIRLASPDAPSEENFAVVGIPGNYPRTIALMGEGNYRFVLIEDIISERVSELFKGYEVTGKGLMRITRGAEMTLDEEKDEDFAQVMSDALRGRIRNNILRLEIQADKGITTFIQEYLKLEDYQICPIEGWLDFKGLSAVAYGPVLPHLKNPTWNPVERPEFDDEDNIWDCIREKDLLVHYPYESFDAYLQFLKAASEDPDVLAIKQTLYRASTGSAVIAALERAALNGKQVTALIELKARFDEKANIQWAHRLENAGVTVIYGIAGLKTHAKACIVVRREVEGVQRYVHLSTGNFNEKTAKIYSDLGLFTADEDMANDITAFFNVVTGYSQPIEYAKIEMAPFRLRTALERLIEREINHARKNRTGAIYAKMNSLVDKKIIDSLYKASQSGVKIKLNIRGICCLRPQVKGLSENIEVISIVDQFLEHSRIFHFYNNGKDEVFLSSADWMPRNFDRRLEIMFPIEELKIKKELIKNLSYYFKDNTNAWILDAQGQYKRESNGTQKKFRVQKWFCQQTQKTYSGISALLSQDLKPKKPTKRKKS